MNAEDCAEADAAKNDVSDEDVNMDSKSEVDESATDTKRADPVLNGTEKVKSAPADSNGGFSWRIAASSQTTNSMVLSRPYRSYYS